MDKLLAGLISCSVALDIQILSVLSSQIESLLYLSHQTTAKAGFGVEIMI